MLETLAIRQHSVFTLAQALEAGFTRPPIRRKLETKEWIEVEPRAYRVALSGPLTWRGRLHALLLSTGGVASHRSAGALHKLLPPPEAHDLTIVRSARTRSTAWAYSTGSLDAIDVVSVDHIRATAPARTLIDLAGILPTSQFEEVLDLAIVTRVVRPRSATDTGTGTLGAAKKWLRRRPRSARRARSGAGRVTQRVGSTRPSSGPRLWFARSGRQRAGARGRPNSLPRLRVAARKGRHRVRRVRAALVKTGLRRRQGSTERARRRRLAALPPHQDCARA